MKNLTINWLQKHNACNEAIIWYKEQKKDTPINIINMLIEKKEHLDWAN